MVATTHPLAAQAGLEVLKGGGNAIDAAVAAAGCLTVVEPTANGIGGDAFARIWTEKHLYGLNASGPAPRGMTPNWVRGLGFDTMPRYGWASVTVPGAPAAWEALSTRWGRVGLERALAQATRGAFGGRGVAAVGGTVCQGIVGTRVF